MLQFRGHPFVDAGIAALTVMAGRDSPQELTDGDLEAIANELAHAYSTPPLKSFIYLFFPNAAYIHPSMGAEARQKKLHWLLHELRTGQGGQPHSPCAFCGDPSVWRADREHVPLLTAQATMNFTAGGRPGLPICGGCLFAVQALPMAALPCDGRALVVHSDDPGLVLDFARVHVEFKRKLCALALGSGSAKIAHLKYHRSRLIDALVQAEQRKRDASIEGTAPSVSIYHFTNTGQSAAIGLYHLPSEVIDFIRIAQSQHYAEAWRAVANSAWEVPTERRRKADDSELQTWRRRNYLYEDLFMLPEQAPRFVRTYLLRRRVANAPEWDPRQRYSPGQPLKLWQLAELFLRRVMGMDRERIAQIRVLGDRLAGLILEENDRKLFRGLLYNTRYSDLRNLLIKTASRHRSHGEPVVRLEEFLAVFEDGEELGHSRWDLGRDLVLIRILERLHEQGWLSDKPDLVEEESAEGGTSA